MTNEQIQEVLARHIDVEFTIGEFESVLVRARNDLIAAGATSADLERAASHLTNNVMEDSRIPSRARAAMLPIFESVFGETMTALRARVAADAAAWQAMKAGNLPDEEIEEALARGHSGVKGLGWSLLGWLLLLFLAWRYSWATTILVFLAPIIWFVIKTFLRVRSKVDSSTR